jgi:hypothetical protein
LIEPRIYRAAFLPAVLAVVLVMFSLENRPRPLPQGLPADVLFDGRLALRELRQILREQPDRRPGTPGDAALARTVAERFSGAGFDTRLDRFEAEGEDLVNVVGRRAGASGRQIAVVAARDSGPDDATGSAADTAALLEVARVLEGRVSRKALVVASVDGSTLGDAGARRLADTLPDRDQLDAVIVLSNLGAPARAARGPLIVAWSSDASRGGIGLERTVAGSLRQELGGATGGEGAAGQLARLAFPIGLGAQGILLERGIEAVRLSGSGELPPPRSDRGLAAVDPNRLGALGRATLRTADAIDRGGELEHGPPAYVTVARQVLPGWVVSVLALSLLVPALVAAVDAFARTRRRREPVARWGPWLVAGTLPFLAGLAVAELLVLTDRAPDAPSGALPPDAEPLDAGAVAVLGVTLAVVALVWVGLRPGIARLLAARAGTAVPGDPSAAGARSAAALLLTVAALVVWAVNPFAALVLAPAVHLWMIAALADPPLRGRISAGLVLAGMVPLAAVAAIYLDRLSLDPVQGAWYLFLLVTGHEVGLATALLGCVLLGGFASILAILVAGARQGSGTAEPEPRSRVLGPGGYAGPGSLGGTESALRR